MFRGLNKINLDAKGRIAIPVRYKDSLSDLSSNLLICTIDQDHCLLLYPLKFWKSIEKKIMELPTLHSASRRLQRLMVGHAAEIEMDPETAAKMAMQTKVVQATYTDLRNDLPKFRSGDTISVGYRVIEGSRSRIQSFDGVVIKISSGHGLDQTFTVRKISGGIGVERIFPFHSPNIESIKVLKAGNVRRAKLYYLRRRKGKATRIREKTQ